MLAAICLVSRDPARLFRAQLWAEDGLWFANAYMNGWRALFQPHTGYFQTLPRLVACAGAWLPTTQVPTLFALAGFAVQLTPIALLLNRRAAALIPALWVRLLLIAFYVGVPNSAETFINLTDAQWHLAIVSFLLLVLPLPIGTAARTLQAIALIICGLSGPFSILLAPLAWWEVRGDMRRPRAVQAAIITLTGAVQGIFIVAQSGISRSLAPLGASLNLFTQIMAGQIFMSGMIGVRFITQLEHNQVWGQGFTVKLYLLVCLALVGLAFLRGPGIYRKFLIYAVLILTVAMASPVASGTFSQWRALAVPGAGSRYYLMPILAWFATILVLAGDQSSLIHWPARLLILPFIIGMVADWHYAGLPPTTYQRTAARFDAAARGTAVIFSENPNPAIWLFSLTKH